MTVTIKYFGAIAEGTGKSEEEVDLTEVGGDLESVKAYCLKKYNRISNQSFKIAVDQNLVDHAVLRGGEEIALLPPFAGG